MYAAITAIDHAVPVGSQTAEQLAPLIGKSEDWICQHAGVRVRHTSQLSDDPAQLVASIAKPMVERFGEPDLILHAGAMRRQLLPDMSVFIARELGLAGVPGFTVNATCLSFPVALQVATGLIRSGANRRILICCSEFATRGRNFDEPESAALMGDASAAALVELTDRPSGIAHYAMETWPDAAEFAEVRGGGVMHPPNDPSTCEADNLFHMQGDRLLRFVFPRLKRFLREFHQHSGVAMDDIRLIVPHQASASGMKLLSRLGMPMDRVVDILVDYGNCVAASIPMALSIAHNQGRIARGDRVLLLGTSAGVSIGAALVRW